MSDHQSSGSPAPASLSDDQRAAIRRLVLRAVSGAWPEGQIEDEIEQLIASVQQPAPASQELSDDRIRELWRSVSGPYAELTGPLIRFAHKIRAGQPAAPAEAVRPLIEAAEAADWQQVVLNGGPPCFHLEPESQKFCLRAERWDGHTDNDAWPEHRFVSLRDLFASRAPLRSVVDRLRAQIGRVNAALRHEHSHRAETLFHAACGLAQVAAHVASILQAAPAEAPVCPECGRPDAECAAKPCHFTGKAPAEAVRPVLAKHDEWRAALVEADRRMKLTDGHSWLTILKTRCQYCGRSPRQKGRCARWFDTFCDELYRVLSAASALEGSVLVPQEPDGQNLQTDTRGPGERLSEGQDLPRRAIGD